MRLALPDRTLEIEPGRPLLMGIVNASPESFSDGSEVSDLDTQVQRALALIEQGADLIDVGGESGVTNIAPISVEEEARRVVPLVERLAAEDVIVSVDTWKPPVAQAVLEAGAAIINDVSGLRDPLIADACAAAGAALVIMHTRAEPKHKDFPGYDDTLGDVLDFLRERMALASQHGVGAEHIVLDPGPDFAKTPAETVEVLAGLKALVDEFERPVLLAASRKDFIGAVTGRGPRDRLAGTLAAVGEGVDAGAAILRVHDVAETRDYLRVRDVLRGVAKVPEDLRLEEKLRRESG
ncbi:MAG TPA: dihydropteroate synthase [Thermoleophilaceae bacterium]|nr:dihydropteroate synthase [Thermoleophilaceae bacterium]